MHAHNQFLKMFFSHIHDTTNNNGDDRIKSKNTSIDITQLLPSRFNHQLFLLEELVQCNTPNTYVIFFLYFYRTCWNIHKLDPVSIWKSCSDNETFLNCNQNLCSVVTKLSWKNNWTNENDKKKSRKKRLKKHSDSMSIKWNLIEPTVVLLW